MSKAVPPKTVRLIPARAGNTIKLTSYRYAMTAHPRSRGEHFTRLRTRFFADGSSPLARGTLYTPIRNIFGRRLIPARAGNTHTDNFKE